MASISALGSVIFQDPPLLVFAKVYVPSLLIKAGNTSKSIPSTNGILIIWPSAFKLVFEYVSKVSTDQYKWQAMGSGRYIYCFGSFQSKAKKAYEKAKEAIEDESKYPSIANSEWRDIYGYKFPLL